AHLMKTTFMAHGDFTGPMEGVYRPTGASTSWTSRYGRCSRTVYQTRFIQQEGYFPEWTGLLTLQIHKPPSIILIHFISNGSIPAGWKQQRLISEIMESHLWGIMERWL